MGSSALDRAAVPKTIRWIALALVDFWTEKLWAGVESELVIRRHEAKKRLFFHFLLLLLLLLLLLDGI